VILLLPERLLADPLRPPCTTPMLELFPRARRSSLQTVNGHPHHSVSNGQRWRSLSIASENCEVGTASEQNTEGIGV
jgi:hypothetical protein